MTSPAAPRRSASWTGGDILRVSSPFQSALRNLKAAIATAQSELIARNVQETAGLSAKKKMQDLQAPNQRGIPEPQAREKAIAGSHNLRKQRSP